jgi:hypothetical protein
MRSTKGFIATNQQHTNKTPANGSHCVKNVTNLLKKSHSTDGVCNFLKKHALKTA